MLRVLDLFSGIGGFSLGLERTGGFKTVAFCEIDPFCRQVLAKHWPGVPLFENVRELTGDDFDERIDIMCGGFPCQDVSIAGNREGLDGERSGLWAEMRRLLGELRPTYVVVENTTGLLDLGMGRVLGGLAELGYDAVWHSISAAAVGAAHQRDRIWIIAHNRKERWGLSPIHNEQHARAFLQNINRELALSCGRSGKQQPDADALAHFGARIPDEPDQRVAYLRSALCRKSDGLPAQLDAVGALGNAVVPHIPEIIGRAILTTESVFETWARIENGLLETADRS